MKHSLIFIAIAFATGVCLAPSPGLTPCALWYAALSVTLVSTLLIRARRIFLTGLLVSIALLGALRTRSAQPPLEWLYRRAMYLNEATGTVVSYPDLGKGYTAFVLAPDTLPRKIRVTWFQEDKDRKRLCYGDRLHLAGTVTVPPRFPEFNYRSTLARQGIFATMVVNDGAQVEWIGTGGSVLLRRGDALRQSLFVRLDRLLSPVEAGLAHGLLFGERALLTPNVKTAFRRTGLMHLLAVSGLHLGIFLAGLWFILRLLGLRPVVAYPFVGLAVLLVLWVVGPRVSLVRAALLFAFLALGSVLADLGVILRRWISPYQGLAAAALVILAIRPTALFDIGFQLSFGATAAIIAVFDPTIGVRQWIDAVAKCSLFPTWCVRYPLTLLVASLAAQAGTAPFLAVSFGTIHPVAVVANLVVVPLASCALWSGLATLVLPAGTLFGWTLKALVWAVERFGSIPVASLAVPSWMGIWLGGFVLFLFGVVLYSRGASSWTL